MISNKVTEKKYLVLNMNLLQNSNKSECCAFRKFAKVEVIKVKQKLLINIHKYSVYQVVSFTQIGLTKAVKQYKYTKSGLIISRYQILFDRETMKGILA